MVEVKVVKPSAAFFLSSFERVARRCVYMMIRQKIQPDIEAISYGYNYTAHVDLGIVSGCCLTAHHHHAERA